MNQQELSALLTELRSRSQVRAILGLIQLDGNLMNDGR